MRYEPIDLELLGIQGAISSYLLLSGEPALVDPGPSTTLETLRRGLADRGLALGDLDHVLLTHVHLDHAGVTGHLVGEVPGLTVHAHADAAAHLVDPERLVASTRRTFGDDHDRLWGPVKPVPAARIRAWSPGDDGPLPHLEALATPGHIDHHVAYLDRTSGTLFAGDAMGIVLSDAAPTHPPTPPPSLNVEAWFQTLERIRRADPDRIAVAHFGVHGRVRDRVRQLHDRLRDLQARVRDAMDRGDDEDAERYEAEVRELQSRFLPESRARRYFGVFGAATDWRGVKFYLERLDDDRHGT